MAASCSTASYSGRKATLTVDVSSQSIENNQTTLSWKLEVTGGSSNYYNAYEIKAVVAGTTVYGPVTKDWSTQAFPAAKGTKTGTVVIDHNTDGTHSDVTILVRGSFYNNNPSDHTATLSIPTIPRASTPSCNNVTLGNQTTITCTRASSNFSNKLLIKDGSTTVETFSNVGDSYNWTPTVATYCTRIVSSKTFTIECITYLNSTQTDANKVGSKTTTVTLTFPSSGYEPTCSISKSANNSISGWPSGWPTAMYVQGKSKVNITVGFSSSYGASQSTVSSSIDGMSSSSNIWTSGYLTSSGTRTISANVKDNRGRTASTSTTISVIAYATPTVTISATRSTDTTLKVTYSFNISPVNYSSSNRNAHSFKLEYKKSSASSWTQMVNDTSNYSRSNSTATATIETTSSYDIRATITDSWNTSGIVTTTSIGTVFDLMNFNSSGLAMAIGKMSEAGANEKKFEVGADMRSEIGNGIIKTQKSVSWYQGRANAAAANTKTSDSGFHPVCSSKSKNGDWSIGTYGNDDTLRAIYTTDTNYNAGTNTVTTLLFPTSGGTLARTADIPSVGNGTITMQINGSNKGTFTTNQSGNTTINMGTGYAATSSLPTYGSNSNGSYIRFPNIGVQICWHYMALTTGSSTSSITTSGNVYYVDGTWTYPAAFSTTPVVSVTATDIDTGVFGADINKSDTNPIGTTSCLVTAYGPAKSRKTGVQLIAIGKYS